MFIQMWWNLSSVLLLQIVMYFSQLWVGFCLCRDNNIIYHTLDLERGELGTRNVERGNLKRGNLKYRVSYLLTIPYLKVSYLRMKRKTKHIYAEIVI